MTIPCLHHMDTHILANFANLRKLFACNFAFADIPFGARDTKHIKMYVQLAYFYNLKPTEEMSNFKLPICIMAKYTKN